MDTVDGKDVDRETKVLLLLLSSERASPNSHLIAVGYANVGHMHKPAVGLNKPCLGTTACASYADQSRSLDASLVFFYVRSCWPF